MEKVPRHLVIHSFSALASWSCLMCLIIVQSSWLMNYLNQFIFMEYFNLVRSYLDCFTDVQVPL